MWQIINWTWGSEPWSEPTVEFLGKQNLRPRQHQPWTPAAEWPTLVDAISLSFWEETVTKAIMGTAKKAPGPDGLDSRLVKAVFPVLLPLLCELFAKALREGLPENTGDQPHTAAPLEGQKLHQPCDWLSYSPAQWNTQKHRATQIRVEC